MRQLLVALLLCVLLLAPARADEERPVNFIFLIDVSGSMLFKQTMVTARDGSQVTLFEALRQALVQVAQDPRLINSKSKISYITFGTKVNEKSDWPSKLTSDADRQSLIKMIQSPDALNADKHGDTYMGGALSLALDKANQMYSQDDPCTATFIVMLTDGWDEPPAGATIKVRNVASQLTAKQKELFSKLGVKTWNVMVIGLQRLPEKKVGTTTAKELADLLGGGFIDVSKNTGGTVSDRIFLALKNQVEQLKGQLTLGNGLSLKNGVLDFGTLAGGGTAKAAFPLELNSCYAETISGLKDVTGTIPKNKAATVLKSAQAVMPGPCSLSSSLPSGAIAIELVHVPVEVAPQNSDGKRKATAEQIDVVARAHSSCPAGQFAGCIQLLSTAKVPEFIPWVLRVPGRLAVEPETIAVKIRKPGFLWSEATEVELSGKVKELPGAHTQALYDVKIKPQAAQLTQKSTVEARLPVEAFNKGKEVDFSIDTAQADSHEFKMMVEIPANQKPGKYTGSLRVGVTGPAEVVAPDEIAYEITVEPSPWEEVAPIAVPMLLVLALVVAFGIFLWLSNPRRN